MSENNQERFPMGLNYGDGQYISSEQLVAQAALLRAVLGGQLDSASRNLDHEPISYPCDFSRAFRHPIFKTIPPGTAL